MYATCTALRIFENTLDRPCRVEYAITGQAPMLHALSAGATVALLGDQQFPLGLLAGPPYQGKTVELLPGDILLVATDGILEAEKEDGTEFGLERLQAMIVDNRSEPLAVVAARIHTALAASYLQIDDQSLLLVRLPS